MLKILFSLFNKLLPKDLIYIISKFLGKKGIKKIKYKHTKIRHKHKVFYIKQKILDKYRN